MRKNVHAGTTADDTKVIVVINEVPNKTTIELSAIKALNLAGELIKAANTVLEAGEG